MNRSIFAKALSTVLLGTALSMGAAMSADAAAFIDNGTIQLGVNDEGHLNIPGGSPSLGGTTDVGLRFLPTGAEATAPGCLCEGWGVAIGELGIAGYANVSVDGVVNLTSKFFSSDGVTATSIVDVAGGLLEVTHKYVPSSATDFLYEALVSIKNTSSANINDLRYRRVMDWDIEPTAFDEFVTIQGTSGASAVLFASDNGFASANPLSGPSSILFTGDAVNSGPADHGALFDFGFGPLAIGETFNFSIFYGAAPNQRLALEALAAVGAEVYSLGKPSSDPVNGAPNTFMFAFKGVGGTPIDPNPIPTPALLPGLLGMGVAALRKRKQEGSESEA